MSEINYAIGVDIGTSKVRAVLAYREYAKVSILGYEEEPYSNEYEAISYGKIVNSENTSRTINKVLASLSERFDHVIDKINVSISIPEIGSNIKKEDYVHDKGEKFTISNATIENILFKAKEGFKENTRDKELIHALPTDFYGDEKRSSRNPIGNTVNKLTCDVKNIFIAPKYLDEYYDALRGVEMQGTKSKSPVIIENLVYSPLADIFSLLTEEDKSEGVVICNIGAGLTKISVYQNNSPRLISVIPFGSDNITQDIQKAFQVNNTEAENLKRACMVRESKEIEINEIMTLLNKDGLPSKRFLEKSVAEVAEWRLKEIISIAHHTMLNAGINQLPQRGIILAGEMASIPVVTQLVRKEFASDAVRIGVSTRNVSSTANLELAHPRFSTVVGLTLSQLIPFDNRFKTLKINGSSKQQRSGHIGKSFLNKFFGGDNLDQRYAD
ncbi:Cell division protein FtsA [Spirosomataceae bacterium TFI 002]|nr:Cell division protein FtsA [Spirosomataceae bacterium TFI 002]